MHNIFRFNIWYSPFSRLYRELMHRELINPSMQVEITPWFNIDTTVFKSLSSSIAILLT